MAGYHVDYRKVDGVWIATQEVSDLRIITGSFERVISNLQEESDYWNSQIGQLVKVTSYYVDGHHNREVIFDNFTIQNRYGEDDYVSYFIEGKRKAIPEEIAALEQKQQFLQEERREQYEQLKKEFGE